MNSKSPHEPEAEAMDAQDVWEDARRLAGLLQRNRSQTDVVVQLPIPFSLFLAALDGLDQNELVILRKRIDEKLLVG